MACNDPIADLLTRIRNAGNAKQSEAIIPYSKINESIANIICKEGFTNAVNIIGEGKNRSIVVSMKYTEDGKPVFANMQRVSKLGRRQYFGVKNIKASRQGMGVTIFSTPKGVLRDVDAKRLGVGGEALCVIW